MKNKILLSLALVAGLFFAPLHADDTTDKRVSFAVIWTVETDDADAFKHAVSDQAAELVKLWQSGDVENIYLDNKEEIKVLKKGMRARVVFFVKATDKEEAKKIIDELPFVKKKVASYVLQPVGVLWLKQF